MIQYMYWVSQNEMLLKYICNQFLIGPPHELAAGQTEQVRLLAHDQAVDLAYFFGVKFRGFSNSVCRILITHIPFLVCWSYSS